MGAAIHNGHPSLQLAVPHLGNALGNGAWLVGNEKLPLFPAEHIPQNFRELPQVVGGEHAVHMGVALFDTVGDLGFACHAATQEDFLSGVAALGVDQSAITATGRSTACTYLGFFDEIRKVFAAENQVDAGLFSFNSKGACPSCKGRGAITTELVFMDPVTTVCEACEGKRYSKDAIQNSRRKMGGVWRHLRL